MTQKNSKKPDESKKSMTQSAKAASKNATKRVAKDAAKSGAKGAVKGAVQGAARGVPGMASGAARGAASGVAKSAGGTKPVGQAARSTGLSKASAQTPKGSMSSKPSAVAGGTSGSAGSTGSGPKSTNSAGGSTGSAGGSASGTKSSNSPASVGGTSASTGGSASGSKPTNSAATAGGTSGSGAKSLKPSVAAAGSPASSSGAKQANSAASAGGNAAGDKPTNSPASAGGSSASVGGTSGSSNKSLNSAALAGVGLGALAKKSLPEKASESKASGGNTDTAGSGSNASSNTANPSGESSTPPEDAAVSSGSSKPLASSKGAGPSGSDGASTPQSSSPRADGSADGVLAKNQVEPVDAASGGEKSASPGSSAGGPLKSSMPPVSGRGAADLAQKVAQGPSGVAGVAAAGLSGAGSLSSKDSGEGKKDADGESGEGSGSMGALVPRLGAAGTSKSGSADDADEESGSGKLGKNIRRAAVVGAVANAPQAVAVIMLLALLAWLKSFFFSLMALAANAWMAFLTWAIGAAAAIGKTIATPFVAIGAGIANMFSGTIAAGTVLASATVMTATSAALIPLLLLSLIGGFVSMLNSGTVNQNAGLTSIGSRCVSSGGDSTTVGDTTPVDATVEANAQIVYSVLKTWNMPDENIAGILGNWSNESGIDATSVEGIFTEPYRIGPRKQAAWDSDFNHMGYVAHSGIGLGQWTNSRNQLLIAYAESQDADWYSLALQLKFMAAGDNPGDVAVFKDMISNSKGSPAAAATFFHDNWERSADTAAMIASRGAKAEQWYAKMSAWDVDESLVDSLLGDFVAGVENVVETVYTLGCSGSDETTTGGALAADGLDQAGAQKVIDLYLSEGDAFLDNKYGSGGPGTCGEGEHAGKHSVNCVSFSIYFMNKYTTFNQYAPGNGESTADSIAAISGKTTSKTPTAYSVFSIAGGTGGVYGAAGHTGVVMGITDDESLIIAQAGYCRSPGEVTLVAKSVWQTESWSFVDVADLMKGDLSEESA